MKYDLCLPCWEQLCCSVLNSRETVITAFTTGGAEIRPCGVTLKATHNVGNVLGFPYWQTKTTDMWSPIAIRPTAIVFENHFLADVHDPLGLFGRTIQVVESAGLYVEVDEKPCAIVDEIGTPPTPPGFSYDFRPVVAEIEILPPTVSNKDPGLKAAFSVVVEGDPS